MPYVCAKGRCSAAFVQLWCNQNFNGLSCRRTPITGANDGKKNRVHETLRLLGRDSFREPRDRVAGIVDGDVDATGFDDSGIHSPLDRGVISYIQLTDV